MLDMEDGRNERWYGRAAQDSGVRCAGVEMLTQLSLLTVYSHRQYDPINSRPVVFRPVRTSLSNYERLVIDGNISCD